MGRRISAAAALRPAQSTRRAWPHRRMADSPNSCSTTWRRGAHAQRANLVGAPGSRSIAGRGFCTRSAHQGGHPRAVPDRHEPLRRSGVERLQKASRRCSPDGSGDLAVTDSSSCARPPPSCARPGRCPVAIAAPGLEKNRAGRERGCSSPAPRDRTTGRLGSREIRRATPTRGGAS